MAAAFFCALTCQPVSGSERLGFRELYGAAGPLGVTFSATAQRLRGQIVVMRGYLAPPLKAEARFFVLGAQPLAICPFWQSDADWPGDIVVVYPRGGTRPSLRSGAEPVEVSGVLELGSRQDPDTGFLSLVRLVDAVVGRG